MKTPSSTHQIRWVGAGAYCTTDARLLPAGWVSISAAPTGPLASPVARPCRHLAT
jgi:hypothetical protein